MSTDYVSRRRPTHAVVSAMRALPGWTEHSHLGIGWNGKLTFNANVAGRYALACVHAALGLRVYRNERFPEEDPDAVPYSMPAREARKCADAIEDRARRSIPVPAGAFSGTIDEWDDWIDYWAFFLRHCRGYYVEA